MNVTLLLTRELYIPAWAEDVSSRRFAPPSSHTLLPGLVDRDFLVRELGEEKVALLLQDGSLVAARGGRQNEKEENPMNTLLLIEVAAWVDMQQSAFAKLMVGAIIGGPSNMEALSQEMKAAAKRMV